MIRSFTVPLVDDALVEDDETVSLALASPTGGAVSGLVALDIDAEAFYHEHVVEKHR